MPLRLVTTLERQLDLFGEPPPPPTSATGEAVAPSLLPPPAAPCGPATLRHPQAQREIELDGVVVGYHLRRSKRRSIGLQVGMEGLAVAAPRWTAQHEIDEALRAKALWIVRKLHEQDERARRLQRARIAWQEGAGIAFLGETAIIVLDSRIDGVQLDAGAQALPGVPRLLLRVGLPQHAQAGQIRDAVHGWLQRQARRVFAERCERYAARLGVRVRRLALSNADARWGSARADGSIRLNWRLVHFALPTIDYVVAHELAHLREMNHSPAFWDVVRSVLPQYEAARDALRDAVLPPPD